MRMISSPLRYPGGKASLTGFLAATLECNDMSGGIYAEPFCGGAGAALNLLFCGYVKRIILNDIDPMIYAFWRSVIDEPEAFIKLIEKTPVTIDEWHKQRAIAKDRDSSLLELGFATFFLNRSNRSGILQATPIGGLNQTGKWKIDARYKKDGLIKRIEQIAIRGEVIQVENRDALSFLREITKPLTEKCFIYFDPPYLKQGPALYLNALSDDGHEELAYLVINELGHHWLMTYDNTEKIKKLYSGVNVRQFDLNYSAHHHRKGEEVLIYPQHTIVNLGDSGFPSKLTFLKYTNYNAQLGAVR